MKAILRLLLLFLLPIAAFGQSVALTGTVTDTPDAQTWNNGTITFTFFGPQSRSYIWTGGTIPTPITAALSATGTYSVSIPDNSQMTPGDSSWTVRICPAVLPAQTGCSIFSKVITSATPVVNFTPASPRFNVPLTPQSVTPTSAYADAEIAGGWVGFQYYNLVSQTNRVCQTVTGQTCTLWAAAGGSSSPANVFQVTQTNILFDYQFQVGDNPCTAKDYSTAGNNVTSCAGTPPTIAPSSGGLVLNATGVLNTPVANNALKTLMVFLTFQGLSQGGTQSTIIGGSAGNFAANSTQFELVSAATPYTQALTGAFHIRLAANGLYYCTPAGLDVFNGIGTLGVTFGANAKIYINGINLKDYGPNSIGGGCQFSPAGVMTSGNYQIGGLGGVGNMTATISRMIGYSDVKSDTDMAIQSNLLTEQMNARGVVAKLGAATVASNRISWVGNSETFGIGMAVPFTSLLNNFFTANFGVINNVASSGFLARELDASSATTRDTLFLPGAAKDAAVLGAGTNDVCVGGGTPTSTFANNVNWIRSAKQVVFKAGWWTPIGRTGCTASIQSLASLMRDTTIPDFLIDLGGTTQLCSTCFGNATWMQGDQVHWNDNANNNLVAFIMGLGPNRAYGNHNFTTANTYTVAATGAITTTSGSESGNTVTINFAAGSKCLTGTLCTCTGITPLGYNQTYFINANLTGTATQFTGYNATTGLGAITVQGSCDAPMQQDPDQFFIVNFGAGNFPLQPGEGYTGQNICGKNINAVATTIVAFPGSSGSNTPWTAETFDGGAATFSLAGNSQACWQSKLASVATGGSNWVRVL